MASKRPTSWFVRNQIRSSVYAISAIGIGQVAVPSAKPQLQKFTSLSFYDADTNRYGHGWDDLYYVFFWIAVFTAVRAIFVDHLFVAVAGRYGITKRSKRVRFAEQGWLAVYYTASWSVGMFILSRSPYWLTTRNVWAGFPDATLDGLVKWYYLVQFAFWLQQIVVINIEARRKDHWQMLSHHVFTCSLLFFSYGFYQTKVGNLILCLMDGVDILLSTAKMLKYLGFQVACDVMFGLFCVAWFVARHVLYNLVCWSIYKDVPVMMPYGCYNVATGQKVSDESAASQLRQGSFGNLLHAFSAGNQPICFTSRLRNTFLWLLVALQAITLVWFAMILRLAINVLAGQAADDQRSEDELSDTEDEKVGLDDDRDWAEQVVDEKAGWTDRRSTRVGLSIQKSVINSAGGSKVATRDDKSVSGLKMGVSTIPIVSVTDGTTTDTTYESAHRRRHSRRGSSHASSTATTTTTAATIPSAPLGWGLPALSATSAISLPGNAGPCRELLGRIGCEKTAAAAMASSNSSISTSDRKSDDRS